MKRHSILFAESLARLLENGCTVRESLELLSSEKSNGSCRRTSLVILESLGRGRNLSEALRETGIFATGRDDHYITEIDRTGDVLKTLSRYLSDRSRESDLASSLFRTLAYPAFIMISLTVALVLLAVFALPWLRGSGLLKGNSLDGKIGDGIALTLFFAFIPAITVPTILYAEMRKRGHRAALWALLSSLADSGLPFEACVGKSAKEISVNDEYTTQTLITAERTGNYEESFACIARYHERRYQNFCSTISRLAEPVAMLIAGIALSTLAIAVFVPLFNLQGGIL
jgi:type II secretory pathway component PulF